MAGDSEEPAESVAEIDLDEEIREQERVAQEASRVTVLESEDTDDEEMSQAAAVASLDVTPPAAEEDHSETQDEFAATPMELTTAANLPGHRRRSSLMSRRSSVSARRSSVVSSTQDFDEFQEEEDDDFGDFEDEVYQEEEPEERPAQPTPLAVEASRLAPLPNTTDEAAMATFLEKTVASLFDEEEPAPLMKRSTTIMTENEDEYEEESPFMLTDRAVSLWKQLTAPPPLQPPAWKHSRVRRLFLVSLGIPLDLDEILPKMTHKKLVLPSTKKKDRQTNTRRRKIPPPPEFELQLARQVSGTTEAALNNMDHREKTMHIATLKAHTQAASSLLKYWLEQREVAQTDKETLEAVVENLVKFHKRQMDEQVKKQAAPTKKKRFTFMSGS